MIFGNTFCRLTHKPIGDGDTCMLIPLGFCMNFAFDNFNKADINCFINLYNFVGVAEEVIFKGNLNVISDLEGNDWDKWELFMLIDKGVWDKLQKNYYVPLCEKTQDIAYLSVFSGLRSELINYIGFNKKIPNEYKQLAKLYHFMKGLDIPITPTCRTNQDDRDLKLYKKLLK